MEQDHDKKVNVDDDFGATNAVLVYCFLACKDIDQGDHRVTDHEKNVKGETKQEQKKVPMIIVSKAIVHESAVMVETLHALVTIVAMHGVFRSQIFTVDADVIQVEFFVNQAFHQTQEIFL